MSSTGAATYFPSIVDGHLRALQRPVQPAVLFGRQLVEEFLAELTGQGQQLAVLVLAGEANRLRHERRCGDRAWRCRGRGLPEGGPPGGGTLSAPRRREEDMLMDRVQVVQEFIDAFNARDVNRVVGCFSADAVMQNDPGRVFARGAEAIRAHFGQFLPQSANLHAEIRSRIHVGAWVVQEEHATGLVLGEPVPEFSIIAAYCVEDGKIVKCIGLQ